MPAVWIPSDLRLPRLRDHVAQHSIGMPGLRPGFPPALPVMRRAPLWGARGLPDVRSASPPLCSHRNPSPFPCTFGHPAGRPGRVPHMRNPLSPGGRTVPTLWPAPLPPVPRPALAGGNRMSSMRGRNRPDLPEVPCGGPLWRFRLPILRSGSRLGMPSMRSPSYRRDPSLSPMRSGSLGALPYMRCGAPGGACARNAHPPSRRTPLPVRCAGLPSRYGCETCGAELTPGKIRCPRCGL